MESYYQQAQEYEKEIFQQYVDKCKLFYGMYSVLKQFFNF